jgi:SET domain-containing protein
MPKYTVRNAQRKGVSIGKGLFASEPIAKGDVVVRMNKRKLKRMAESTWQRYHEQHKLPHDGAVYDRQLQQRVSDWPNLKAMPRWYRLNHSSSPNLEMEYRDGNVQWVALRRIRQGAELTFDYGEGTEAFSR